MMKTVDDWNEATSGYTVTTGDDVPDHLKQYVHDGPDGLFTWFHHPLYVTTLPTFLPSPLDQFISELESDSNQRLASGEWEQFIFRHARGYRAEKLCWLVDYLGDWSSRSAKQHSRLWKLVSDVWCDAEFDEADPIWSRMMRLNVPNRKFIMDASERRALSASADADGWVQVFRGVQAKNPARAVSGAVSGWSWSLCPRVAAWFAWRWLNNKKGMGKVQPFVASAKVHIDDTCALLMGRGESEVLIEPKQISITKELKISHAGKRPDHYSN